MATTESDYYELLGVPRTATEADIKSAFRTLARELHPDVSTEPDAGARFRDVAEAYEVLSDPERRATPLAGSVFTDWFRSGRKVTPHTTFVEGLGDEEIIGCPEFDLIDDMVQSAQVMAIGLDLLLRGKAG